MPLHLLGKKSWNVYNPANVDRVRRDEADARAREDAAEQRMQQQDAEARMALLRGERPPALPALTAAEEDEEDDVARGRGRRGHDEVGTHGRKRRLRGEDDTDREMRFAREDAEAGERARRVLKEDQKRDCGRGDRDDDVPLQDPEGHIQLVPVPEGRSKRKADEKDEGGRRRKKDENKEQEQQGLRFTDAAGYRKGTSKPWYASSESRSQADSRSANELMLAELQGRDVWGNEDPRRKEREQSRIMSSDPFAMMQQAQKQLKRSETDREEWRQERDREVKKLKHEEERRRRHDERRDARRSRARDGRRDNKQDEDELEGFSLDGPTGESSKNRRSDHDRHHRRHRHSHHRRERSRSRSREHRRK